MTDDQQRARELLAREYESRGLHQSALDIRTNRMDEHFGWVREANMALAAITSALRAAPEVTEDAIERAAKALHANGADSMTSDTPWSELHDGEANQFRTWARAALIAARPQGVKDAT